MGAILSNAGFLILAATLFFLANRLHKKSASPQAKGAKGKKIAATVISFGAGLSFMGTFLGDFLSDLAGSSWPLAATFFLLSAGVLIIDWWSDGVPDRPAFIAAAFLPLAVVVGFSSLDNVGNMLGDRATRIGETVQNGSK